MAQNENTQTDAGANESGDSGFTPITSQEEFEKALGKRLAHERSKFADYEDVKAKAAQLDELQEAGKSELQKMQEAVEAAERRAKDAESKALRTEVAAEKGVPVSVLTGYSREELVASAEALLEWRASQAGGTARKADTARLKSGATGGSESLTPKEKAAAALRSASH